MVDDILEDARIGRMFILGNHEDHENKRDLVILEQMATSDAINFVAKQGRGLFKIALPKDHIELLELPLMASINSLRHETVFTAPIEACDEVTMGISARNLARMVAGAIETSKTDDEIAALGHVFPSQARNGWVLVRAGRTEAAVDLSSLAGLNPSGVICEIMNEDGTMSRLPELVGFAQKHGLKIGTISDLIAYRRRNDNLVRVQSQSQIVSEFGGEWLMRVYIDETLGDEHVVLTKGNLSARGPVLVRMHALDTTLNLIGIGPAGRGLVVLLRNTAQKMADTAAGSPSKLRQYGLGAQILSSLGLSQLELFSNLPLPKFVGLEAYGLEIVSIRKKLEVS